jgi:hypothetical protein
MINKILLNEEIYEVNEGDLPYLITYKEGMGGSHLSIVLTAQLFSQGSKILFLTAYPMAKDKFLEQTGEDHSNIVFVDSVSALEQAKNFQVVILEGDREDLFIEAMQTLTDLDERIVLVKNIEKFSDKVFDSCLDLKKIILSGNIDECVAKEKIRQKSYKNIIAFNQPNTILPITVPILEKWSGYLSSESRKGVIKVLVK